MRINFGRLNISNLFAVHIFRCNSKQEQ